MIICKSIQYNWVGFLSFCNCLLQSEYLYAILRGRIKALYYNRSINTLYIYMLIWGLCVAYMGYGYKAMLIWWYIYVCVVYDLLYNIMGTYKGWLYNKGTYNSR